MAKSELFPLGCFLHSARDSRPHDNIFSQPTHSAQVHHHIADCSTACGPCNIHYASLHALCCQWHCKYHLPQVRCAFVVGTAGQCSSIGPPVVSNASPSAKELEALVQSVQSTLQELGYAPKARQDMRATSSSQS